MNPMNSSRTEHSVGTGHTEGHFHLARLYDAIDDQQKARLHYQIFLDAWSDADPGLRWPDQAKECLAQLDPQPWRKKAD